MMFLFIIGLIFLIYFSYQDLKHSEVSNISIIIMFIISIPSLVTNLSIIYVMLFFFLFTYLLWRLNSIGGADVKILSIIPIYILIGAPNKFAGAFIFIMLFGLLASIYGFIAKISIKKKNIPLIPIILIAYILFWFYRLYWI